MFPAGTVINLTTVAVDNYGGITTGASGGYTAPVTGNYFCYGQLNLGATAAGGSYGAGPSCYGRCGSSEGYWSADNSCICTKSAAITGPMIE